jgi:biopolymer transport protein ExbD
MAKVKTKKGATGVDMTAMCDVAFLLLTFFILTATAKQPEPLPVDTPSSTVQTKLPETDLAIITVGKSEGKDQVFYGIRGKELRVKALEFMAQKYNVSFTDEEIAQFALLEEFGVPIEGMKQLLAMKSSDRIKAGIQPGIPSDSLNNQLKDWVYTSRQASAELNDQDLKFAIKGDAKELYPRIQKIMDMLQDQDVNSFNLVTGLRGQDY